MDFHFQMAAVVTETNCVQSLEAGMTVILILIYF